ncbi:MAG: hypothetical protein A2854_00470 [Parcubacteria group bacterium RIFCSPHIGHO2_01_FULL_56_18]|nr:MAG: hypothetical protein A2854_00470 [Parcubacteria group bacterium RIFCSPHIGHO2_01_FULL_56_18]
MTENRHSKREYSYSVFGTQGGGLVREVGGRYIFVEKPDCPGLNVGDEMPNEWGTIPANDRARREVDAYVENYFGPSHFGF